MTPRSNSLINVELLSIGNELLSGDVVNRNASIMASILSGQGYRVSRVLVVEDSVEAIVGALEASSVGGQVVIATGGLGPTPDDLTREAVVQFFDNHQLLPNRHGTAPGVYGFYDHTHFFFLPGVTYEMEGLLRDAVLPLLQQNYPHQWRIQRTLHTFGTGESLLAEKLAAIEKSMPPDIHLAYLPGLRQVSLRLWAQGSRGKDAVRQQMDDYEQKMATVLKNTIYGKEEDTLEGVVLQGLQKTGWSLATAESCTGGSIAQRITAVPGSSKSFKGAIIAYDNQVKISLLNVNPQDLKQYGAVSQTVASQMVQNARKVLQADTALAITGIAGPGGGSREKPVGTVWIALATPNHTICEKIMAGNDRSKNVRIATACALNMLRLELEKRNGEKF